MIAVWTVKVNDHHNNETILLSVDTHTAQHNQASHGLSHKHDAPPTDHMQILVAQDQQISAACISEQTELKYGICIRYWIYLG
jgi:hypothetical protein